MRANNEDLRRRAQQALASFVNHKREAASWENRKTLIYGAGGFGRDLAKALQIQSTADILGFLDQKGKGEKVSGDLRSFGLPSPEAQHWRKENPFVVIGVYNPMAPLREIKAQLSQAGFSDIITPMEAYPYVSKTLDWRFWLGTPCDYSAASNPIEQARSLWADQESERIFLETLIFRLGFDLETAVTHSDVALQYADPTLPRWKEPIRLVDGGAYTGDTMQSLVDHGYRLDAVFGFEPDTGNFKKLRTKSSSLANIQVSLWPCGVGASTCRLQFAEGGGTSSKVSASGSAVVPIVAIDDVLHGQSVNLIKLDIEGAEPDALIGARRTIEKNRPGLAVCLYHFPQHLWSIPLWVKGLDLDYRFYCRTYAHNTFETVLYAIPN
jgi:FkbM family methyltransferase